jgi:hypothetical protein
MLNIGSYPGRHFDDVRNHSAQEGFRRDGRGARFDPLQTASDGSVLQFLVADRTPAAIELNYLD